jgi:hypothetical protein
MLQINEYISPLVEMIEVDAEGVLCGSGTESLTEKDGVW